MGLFKKEETTPEQEKITRLLKNQMTVVLDDLSVGGAKDVANLMIDNPQKREFKKFRRILAEGGFDEMRSAPAIRGKETDGILGEEDGSVSLAEARAAIRFQNEQQKERARAQHVEKHEGPAHTPINPLKVLLGKGTASGK